MINENYIGKWYTEANNETLNVIKLDPLRLKISFHTTGYFNMKPEKAYEKDGYLCYEISDRVYHVKLVGDVLEGYHTDFGEDTKITYIRQSKIPDDEPYLNAPVFERNVPIYVPESDKTPLELLRQYADYDNTHAEDYTTEYCLGGEMPAVLVKYGISKYLDGVDKNSDEIPFRMLDFVCDNFRHGSGIRIPRDRTVEGIVAHLESQGSTDKYSGFAKLLVTVLRSCGVNFKAGNCRTLSMLLATIIRFCGIKARHINCIPYEEPFTDCHVVVDCELPSGKRVMLDPTYRLYYTDADGNYVSLERLREMFIAGEKPIPNKTASYNGGRFNLEENYNYMTKNTFRFSRGTYYANGSDDNSRGSVELIPKGYPTDNFPEERKKKFVYNKDKFWEM